MTDTPRPKELVQAISSLLSNFPFYGALLFELGEVQYIPETPTAATDGVHIVVGDWFMASPVGERVFVLAHEVLHIVFDHMPRARLYGKSGFGPDLRPFNFDKWNRAADFIINHLLLETLKDKGGRKLGSMPSCGLYDPSIPYDAMVTDVYLALPDQDDDQGPGKPGQGSGQGFDQHIMPGDDTPTPTQQKVQRAVTSAKNAAKAMGKDLGGLERILNELLSPKVPWTEELRDYVQATTGKDDTSWARPNRRKLAIPPHIPFPGHQGYQMGDAVVAVDCSGSIGDAELTQFRSEIKTIFEDTRPRNLFIIWWDTSASVVEITDMDDLLEAKPVGGGGTDYHCVPPAIEELMIEPEIVICFSDCIASFPTEVPWNHLTVSTTDHAAPFGKTIHMKV